MTQRRRVDLTGEILGRLTVVSEGEPYVAPSGHRDRRWLCRCECGAEVLIHQAALRRRSCPTRSCGCIMRERVAAVNRTNSGPLHVNYGKTGPDSRTWKGDEVRYNAAHDRIVQLRGPARDHVCMDCGEPARDWSYQGGCPRERVQRGVSGFAPDAVMAYSPDPARYVPRCRPCHKRYDNDLRKQAAS